MRDRLLAAAVEARLDQIMAARDVSLSLEPGAVRDARQLAESMDEDDREARFLLGWLYWYQYLALPEGQDQEHLHAAVEAFRLCFLTGLDGLPPEIMPLMAEVTTESAFEFLGSALGSTDVEMVISAVDVWRIVVAATPTGHARRAAMLSNLGGGLRRLFELTGEVAHLTEAVAVSRESVASRPADPQLMINLFAVARLRFDQTGSSSDLDDVITVGRQVVQLASDDRAEHLSRLFLALYERLDRREDPADLDEAVAVGTRAVEESPPEDPHRSARLSNLITALLHRYERVGELADVDKAIALARQATSDPGLLSSLGGALRLRFERTGELSDIDEAIAVAQQAVDRTPTGAGRLSDLGLALETRFERTGALADLDAAITVGRQAVQATPGGDHRHLSNLAFTLKLRFERTSEPADLEESISLGRRAIRLIPGTSIDLPGIQSNLGNALQARFKLAGDTADLDEAISLARQSVEHTPRDHPSLAGRLTNLHAAQRLRFGLTEELTDLDEAISAARMVAELTPGDHPFRAACLHNLAGALHVRFERIGEQSDLDDAIEAYTNAAHVVSARASIRISAASIAAGALVDRDVRRAADLAEIAVNLLPQVAPHQSARSDQQYALGATKALADHAAAMALAVDETDGDRAVRLLEMGRAVLHTQTLGTNSDVADLRTRHPDLAQRFVDLRAALDQPRAIDEFQALVSQIRGLDSTFLQPPSVDQLTRHAEQGPIVMLNVSPVRADALLVGHAGVVVVPLPEFTWDALLARIEAFHSALRSPDWRCAQRTISSTLEWLWDVAAWPILDSLGFSSAPLGPWPRLWWAPGGIAGLLPIHAAGYHGSSHTVMDRVISSYTPTIRALGYARRRQSHKPSSAVIVAMPSTPGMAPLPGSHYEAARIQARVPESSVLVGDEAEKSRVLDHLADCTVAHFACHGINDPVDPSKSRLFLHDSALTVANLADVQLNHAQLVYLSACNTALNTSLDLIDEAINLVTAFQLAGCPHVIGTLWTINDTLAVRIADTFYAALGNDGTVDFSRSASALHRTIRAIRDELPDDPALWASYVHAGA
jgi:tetratricopeptide (TPR) repeat protein